jgi:transcriptional regulator GlxA family with amidase domain
VAFADRWDAITAMKITIVAFEGCMTSAVYGQADTFAIAAYISNRRGDASWSGHDVRIATPDGKPVGGYGGHAIAPHCALPQSNLDGDVSLAGRRVRRT